MSKIYAKKKNSNSEKGNQSNNKYEQLAVNNVTILYNYILYSKKKPCIQSNIYTVYAPKTFLDDWQKNTKNET